MNPRFIQSPHRSGASKAGPPESVGTLWLLLLLPLCSHSLAAPNTVDVLVLVLALPLTQQIAEEGDLLDPVGREGLVGVARPEGARASPLDKSRRQQQALEGGQLPDRLEVFGGDPEIPVLWFDRVVQNVDEVFLENAYEWGYHRRRRIGPRQVPKIPVNGLEGRVEVEASGKGKDFVFNADSEGIVAAAAAAPISGVVDEGEPMNPGGPIIIHRRRFGNGRNDPVGDVIQNGSLCEGIFEYPGCEVEVKQKNKAKRKKSQTKNDEIGGRIWSMRKRK